MPTLSSAIVADAFRDEGIDPSAVEVRDFPGESNVLAFVTPSQFQRSIDRAEKIESFLSKQTGVQVLVVIRRAVIGDDATSRIDVHHAKVSALQRIIAARNRVSEVQPSLSYISDLADNLSLVTAQRHHLIFGRRGVGKSTLLVEARRAVGEAGAITAWVNLQTLRREEPARLFLRIAREMITAILVRLERDQPNSAALTRASELTTRLDRHIAEDQVSLDIGARLIPDIQLVVRQGLGALGTDLYLFIDDFYYVPRAIQPEVLDILHGCIRDCRAWLKVASIKNLTKWFQASPPTGLQTGQDADLIDLDITLQEPGRLRVYLEKILTSYCAEAGISRVSRVFRKEAVDRLLMASGGVPRDFLVLASSGIDRARSVRSARVVGVQNVNRAAGDAADVKLQELEEDVAGNEGLGRQTLDARQEMRKFCLDEATSTFFLVDFRDKEKFGPEYQAFIDLLDMRLVHLIHSSVSDAREAGRKYEAYMLDLSQYTGSRLKQGLRVLDLKGDTIVARRTRTKDTPREARDSLSVIALYRTAPLLNISRFKIVLAAHSS